MNYEKPQYLKRLIDDNYRDMTDEDYQEIKKKLEKIGSDKIDDIFKKALGRL